MCGIAGAVSSRPDPELPELARRMGEVLAHRGPDGEGSYVSPGGHAAFAHRRLAIIDLVTGAQPLTDAQGRRTIAFNGEIYNFRALREELAGSYPFRTASDTEVLLAGHQVLGDAVVQRLRGMFAYALWDESAAELTLVRDRFGKKPLFYAQTGARLVFGSELKAVLLAWPEARTDEVALCEYLALGYVPGARTIYQGISRLPPGHRLRWSARGGIEVSRYWELPLPRDAASSTPAAWEERIGPVLSEAVRLRLVSDVPLGAFLSGGLDSSMVVALALESAPRPFHTFSIRAEGGDGEDAEAAARVSTLLRTTHHETVLSCPSAEEALALLAHADEPFADSSLFPTAAVSALARQWVTVSLSGDGGDELFGGYGLYRQLASLSRWSARSVRAGAAALAAVLPEDLPGGTLLRKLATPPPQRYLPLNASFWGRALERLVGPGERLSAARRELAERFALPAAGPVAAAQWVDAARGYLPGDILPKVDLASMRHGLEVRCPLLDHVLAEQLASLPAPLRMSGGRGKILLRRLARRWLPDSIIERKKRGFTVPLQAWLSGPLRPLVVELLVAPSAPIGGLVDGAAVRSWAAPPRSEAEARLQFNLLSLAAWRGRSRR